MKALKIKSLNEDDSTCLVKDMDSKKQYIEKIVSVRQKSVYEKLKEIDCSCIPKIIAIEEYEDNYIKIYEEYIEGKNLQQLLDEGVTFSEGDVRTIVINICNALEVLHKNGIVHRDIKPSNIIVNNSFECWLIDFGIARTPDAEKNTDTRLLGTKGFAAPEQYGFGQSDERTDIYALGATANYILTGELSFNNIYKGKLTPILVKCMELKPALRYQSAADLKYALTANIKWKIFTGLAAVLVIAIVATILLLNKGQNSNKNFDVAENAYNKEQTKNLSDNEKLSLAGSILMNNKETSFFVNETTENTEPSIEATTEATTEAATEVPTEAIIEITTEAATSCQHVNIIDQEASTYSLVGNKHVCTISHVCKDCGIVVSEDTLEHTLEATNSLDEIISYISYENDPGLKTHTGCRWKNKSCKEPAIVQSKCKYCSLYIDLNPDETRTCHDYGKGNANPFSTVYEYNEINNKTATIGQIHCCRCNKILDSGLFLDCGYSHCWAKGDINCYLCGCLLYYFSTPDGTNIDYDGTNNPEGYELVGPGEGIELSEADVNKIADTMKHDNLLINELE